MQAGAREFVRMSVFGGFTAGTVDIGAAALIYSASPLLILQAIASGALGRAAFQGGTRTQLIGLALQWVMSCIIAAIYVAATRFMPVLVRRWILAGIGYGTIVFGVMNYVVVPLSAAGPHTRFTAQLFIENLLAMWLFGLLVAVFARPSTPPAAP
jgi:hypothetical protein